MSAIARYSPWLSALVCMVMLSIPLTCAELPIIDVRTLGAIGDGVADDTKVLQRALDTCTAAGGGVVRIPAGTYRTGSLVIGSGTTLQVDALATIRGSTNPLDYPMIQAQWEGNEVPARRSLIHANDAHDITITGQGTIMGGDPTKTRTPRGPMLVEFINCRNIRVSGVILRNSGIWTLHPTYCDDVVIDGVTFDTTGPNSDGIDPDSCRRVTIVRCTFATGDDCIAIKSGKGAEGFQRARPTEDVTISDCVMTRGHAAVALGSEMSGSIRRVSINRCRIDGPDRALRLKTCLGRGGVIEDVTAANLTVGKVKQVVQVDMVYSFNADTNPVTGPEGVPRIRRVRIEDVAVDAARELASAVGLDESLIDGFTFRRISGKVERGITLVNAKAVELADISVKVADGPLLKTRNAKGLGLELAMPLPDKPKDK